MKRNKNIIYAALTVFLSMVLLGGIGVAYAAGTDELCYELQAEKSEEGVALRIVATADISTSGFFATVDYDREAFALQSGKAADGFTLNLNSATGNVLIDTAEEAELKQGDTLGVLFFTALGDLQADAAYTFSIDIQEAYSFDLEDYPWVPATVTAAYTGAEASAYTPEESDTFTVTYTDEDGTVLYVETVKKGETTLPPEAPAVSGMTVKGWTWNGTAFDFEEPVNSDMTLVVVRDKAEPEPDDTPDSNSESHNSPDQQPKEKSAEKKGLLWLIPVAAAAVAGGGFLAVRNSKKGKREQ